MDAAAESERGVDVVTGHPSHVVLHAAPVGMGDGASFMEDGGVNPLGVAREQAHQVHQVGSEDHEVLAASPRILLAMGTQRAEFPKASLLMDHLEEAANGGGHAHGVGHGHPQAPGLGQRQQHVGLGRGGDEGLLDVQVGSSIERGPCQLEVRRGMAHRDARQPRPFPFDQGSPVGMGPHGPRPLRSPRAACGVWVRHHDLAKVGPSHEDGVQVMPEPAALRVAENGNGAAGGLRLDGERRCHPGPCGGDRPKELPPTQVRAHPGAEG